jgi:hypothetical protein
VKSFAEASLREAVARQVRVELVLKPVRPGDDARLASRFLAFGSEDRIILEVPRARGRPVFVPAGWQACLAFAVGPYFLQAQTTVLGVCPYSLHETRRRDALLVARPARLASVDRRRSPRRDLAPGRYVFASLWPADRLAGGAAPAHSGRVVNESPGGLGIRLEAPLPCEVCAEVILRLEQGQADQFPIFRAVLRHHARDPEGFWLAGFGEVAELAPGEASSLIEAIAAPAASR